MVLELEPYIENLEKKVARLEMAKKKVEGEEGDASVPVVTLLEEIDVTLKEIRYLKERTTPPIITDLPELVWLNIVKYLPDQEEHLLSLCYASPVLKDMVTCGLKKSMMKLTENKVIAVLASNGNLNLNDLRTCAKVSKSWADAAVSSWCLFIKRDPLMDSKIKAPDIDLTTSNEVRELLSSIVKLEQTKPDFRASDLMIGADVVIDLGQITYEIGRDPKLQRDWNRLLEKCGRFMSHVELVNPGLVTADFLNKVFPNLVQISFTDGDWEDEEGGGVTYWSDITEQLVIQKDSRTLRKLTRYQCVNLMECVTNQLALIGDQMKISKLVIDNAFEGDGHLPPNLMTLTELDLGVGRCDTGCPPFLLREESDEAAGRIETLNLRFSNPVLESLPELLGKTLGKLWKVRDLTLTFAVDEEKGMLQFQLPPSSGDFRYSRIVNLTVCLKLGASCTPKPPDSESLLQFAWTFSGLKNLHLKVIHEEDDNQNMGGRFLWSRGKGNRRSFASILEFGLTPHRLLPPVDYTGAYESVKKWKQLRKLDWHKLSVPKLEKVTISMEGEFGEISKKVVRLKRKQNFKRH